MKNENLKMENDLTETKKAEEAPIVIADECGDTLWDAVLNQEVKACEMKDVSNNAALLLNKIN
jgi:hypothetical protein